MIVNKQYLEGIILSIVNEHKEGIYPYAITLALESKLSISESTAYGICNRLMKNEYVRKNPKGSIVNGRARSYYLITEKGKDKLSELKKAYSKEREVLEKWLV